MRIIGLDGLWSRSDSVWRTLAPAFEQRFPTANIHVERELGCWPGEVRRMRRFVDRLSETYDDGEETLLVGHSMGGVFACALTKRLKQTKVRGIVTICSPHRYLNELYPWILDGDDEIEPPIITFKAALDVIVLYGTRHQQSLQHVTLACDHYWMLRYRRSLADQIAETAYQHFG